MKKGTGRIIGGVVLIVLQLISFVGNAKSGDIGIHISFDNSADLIHSIAYTLGYCAIGIIGLILLIAGIIALSKSEKNK